MTGRITKVLNMKPHEILGMVEEAAGTRMYETKRVAALKTIEKKQQKVDELNSVLSEEITPTLERLRGEKQSYLKWSKNNADIERIERFVIASDFAKAQSALDSNTEGSTAMDEQVEQLNEECETARHEIAGNEQEISALSAKLSGEFDSQLTNAKSDEERKSKALVKITSAWQISKNDVETAETDLNTATAFVGETATAVAIKEQEINNEADRIAKEKQDAIDAEENLGNLQKDYQNMSAGIASSQGEEGASLPQRISQAHSDSKTAEAKATQAKMKIVHLGKALKVVKKDMDKEAMSSKALSTKRDKALAKVKDLQTKLGGLGFDSEAFNTLDQEKVDLDSAVADLRDKVATLSAQLEGRLRFKYSDPVRGFDRSKVKGIVARLVSVRNPENATALEVVAGSRLYQVVVDEAITGKALLNNGKLERRVTIIPLDKIHPHRISGAECERAKKIAADLNSSVNPAIELVGFDEEVRSAVEYVFGSTLVVDGMKAANQICDVTKTKTVTLDGDVYDPSGTISGGSKNNLGSTLAKLTELTSASHELGVSEARLNEVESQMSAMKAVSGEFEKFSEKLDLATAELANVEKHLSQTTFGMLAEQHDAMTAEIDAAKLEYEKMEEEKVAKWELYNELQDKEHELTQHREIRLTQIDEAVKEAKKAAVTKAKGAREAESRSQTLRLELDSLKTEVKTAEQALKAAEKALVEATDVELNLQMKVGEANAVYEYAKIELDTIEEQMSNFSAELSMLKCVKSDLIKKVEKLELDAKKLKVQISKIEKERTNAEKFVAAMMKKHAWIESEKGAFGIAGGDYDFKATKPEDMSAQLCVLKTEQETLAKKINKKVMGMIEKAEGEYTELLRKRKVVENDKKKIQAVIEELDVKKKSELERTWKKVNGDFGSIFATLLPGAAAKLEPPDGMQAWEGLEVKVAFGDAWKESLSELSGGQRSLLALSLILSLLLFKPAPMYILDEVDAALDLSHTQNIGNMLKTHFSQSQFVVVSLKEGMFNNANVIFRTKFVDGVSQVTRTIGTGSSVRARALAEQNQEEEVEPVRKRAANSGSRNRGKENAVAG
jgi:structural maintenance of chromosome 2